ncbi:unnamed protein product [Pylaiella littoralis]
MSVDDSSHDLTAGSLRPGQNIDDLLGQIKVACPSCIETSRADAERLQEFCDLAIRELSEFLAHVAHVKLYSPGDGPEHLDRALHVVLDYMKDKLPLIVAERQLRAFFNLRSPQHHHQHHHHRVPAACDIRNSVRDAVQLHINAVVDAAEGRLDEAIGVHGSGTIRDIRLHGANAVRVMSRLKKMAKSVVFGYEYVVKCERRLEKKGEMTTLNEILACVKKLVKFHEGLDEKVNAILREVDAVRMHQEGEHCPRVFFLLPADKSSWSRMKRIERLGLFTKNMDLFFLCRKFLEEIKPGLQQQQQQQQQGGNVSDIPNLHGHECSERIEVKLTRDRVKKYLPALRLSVKVVKTLALAASVGFPIAGVLPDMELPDLEDLEAALQEGLEAAEEGLEAAAEGLEAAEGEAIECNDIAHVLLQKFLEANSVEWKSKVGSKLKPEHNSSRGYAYVCTTKDQKHAMQWRECAPRS